jgi:tRNA uridine 5-carboxymethylaminomethyl modification enzyme
MLHAMPALREATMLRAGYAVEYDYVPPSQTRASLESKAAAGLFLAGQINGTSGYEEAAAQGLLAGINAALHARAAGHRWRGAPPGHSRRASLGAAQATAEGAGAPLGGRGLATDDGRLAWQPVVLQRSQAYAGVMIDDLTTTEIDEPYRLHTSRAEYRLLLRQDNADLRLTPLAYALGLVSRERYERVERKRDQIAAALGQLARTHLPCSDRLNARLAALGFPGLERSATALEYLRRPGVAYRFLAALGDDAYRDGLPADVAEQVEIEAKYAAYIERQNLQVEKFKRLESLRLPEDLDYRSVTALRFESREKLERIRPRSIGQASRIAGVTPADIQVLLASLEARRRRRADVQESLIE